MSVVACAELGFAGLRPSEGGLALSGPERSRPCCLPVCCLPACCLQEAFDIFELLPVLLLGVIGGLLGSTLTYLNESLTDWRRRGGRCHVTYS